MTMKKVSIIIPCFNNASQVEKAVKSLEEQTYTELEIIVVDDGSDDGTVESAEIAAKGDSRFIFKRLEHGGVSRARNFGLDTATGDYVMFLDADDSYTAEAVEKLVSAAEENGADIVSAGFVKTVERKAVSRPVTSQKGVFSGENKNSVLKRVCDGSDVAVCGFADKLYDLRMLRENGVRFPNAVSGEDSVFALEALIVCSKIVILDDNNFYLYEQHDKSFTRKKLPLEERISLSDIFFDEMEKVLLKHGREDLISFLNSRRVLSVYDFVMNTVSRDDLSVKEKMHGIKTVSESKQYIEKISAESLSHYSARVKILVKSVLSGRFALAYSAAHINCFAKKISGKAKR